MNKEELRSSLKQLSGELSYGAYLAAENALGKNAPDNNRPEKKVAILRNFTLETLIPVIKGEIALAGFYPKIYLGGFDVIAQDVLDQKSALYQFNPDLVILAQWLEGVSPALTDRYISLSPEQAEAEIDRVAAATFELVAALRKLISSPILINNYPLPSNPAYGILDAQSERSQIQSIIRLNLELSRRLKQVKDVYLVDYMGLMARLGSEKVKDERYWQIGKAPIGKEALVPFGREYGKYFRALQGLSRKCLVLDCDNILWGGVVGEDGLGGIQLGTSYPGSCYRAFQQEILNLHDRGVILSLCSKNNEADVLEVLRTHPEMVLREENISTWQINWDDKVTNLKRIAKKLNIGLDSMVFVDDNQFECDLVREQLPQVAVLQLSTEPSTFRNKLSSMAYFDTLTLSAEDRERNRMYRDHAKREEIFASANSLEDYLAGLNMSAEISLADEASIQRIAQLTQKTNQFNLTTQRYTESNIRHFMESPEADVFYLKLQDKIAEMGLVGVAIIKYFGEEAVIDTFLLSCRALGRGVEGALLAQVLNCIKDKGIRQVKGSYLATKKNEQVADFYERQGFRLAAKNASGSDWELSVKDKKLSGPSWIRIRRDYAS